MFDFGDNLTEGWRLTTLSSLLCVCGCFIIYIDDVYLLIFPKWITARYPFHLKENYSFMNGSLGFSAGCLLFTALYRLLPEAMNHLTSYSEHTNSNATVTNSVSFMGGMMICYVFNAALHVMTSESVVHCSHDAADDDSLEGGHQEHNHSHTTDPADDLEQHSHNKTVEVVEVANETVPLLSRKASQKLARFLLHKKVEQPEMGECKGYSSAELCLHNGDELHFCEIPQLENSSSSSLKDYLGEDMEASSSESHHIPAHDTESDQHEHPGHTHAPEHHHRAHNQHGQHHQEEFLPNDVSHQSHLASEHHHHHTNSPLSRLLLIGIQTILAITLHKLPEGFITYVTSETNPELGVSIFLSLLIHNYTEGFLMCLPLYYSFKGNAAMRKLKAVFISAVLGGLSQPLGALAGFFFLKVNQGDNIDLEKLDYVFGITMAVTSGFLTVIALSMFASGVAFSGRAGFVMVWAILGMCVISVLNMFMAT